MKKNKEKEKIREDKILLEPESNEKKMNRRIVLFFFFLCFLIYGKSIKNDYSMDDEFVVRNNMQVQQGVKAIPEIFRTTYVINSQKSNYEYRPIVKATFALECELFGVNPHVSHFFNVLLYALSIVLLFKVLQHFLSNLNIIVPFVITTLFLIHPLHSEVVISIKNRDVILSFIGYLLSLFFYLRFIETKKYHHLFLGAFFILFGLMSKKDAMTIIAVIPFTLWFLKDVSFKRMIPIFISYAFPILVYRFANKIANQNFSRKTLDWENPLYLGSTILDRIPTGLYSIYFYVKMFIFPHPLVSYYGYNQIPVATWSNPIVWIVLVALIAFGYYVFKNIKQKGLEIFGVIFFFITISMFTNIVVPVVGIVGERFAFIPSLGLCFAAAWVLFKLFKFSYEKKETKFPAISSSMMVTLGVFVLLFGGRSFARIKDWRDTYTLYDTDVKNAPESAHANSLIAAACIQKIKENPKMSLQEKRIQVQKAEKYYLESIRIIPNYISSLNNLGMIYYTYYNRPDKSIAYLKKAISLDTNYVEAYFNLATCEAKLKNYDVAEKYYMKTIAIDSNFISTYFSLSAMYAEQKKYDEIIKLNQGAIDKGIKADVLHVNIGNVYFMKGDTLAAIPYFEECIRLNSNNKFLNTFLANYFKEKGDLQKANMYYDLMGASKR